MVGIHRFRPVSALSSDHDAMVAQRVAAFEAAGVDLVLLQFSPQSEEMEIFGRAVIGSNSGVGRSAA